MTRTRRRWIRATLWIGLAGAGLWLWLHWTQRIELLPPHAARPASPLAFRDDGGDARSLGEYRGRIVVVNLWATWCAPCRSEIPRLSAVARETEQAGVTVLGLNVEGLTDGALSRIRREWDIPYTIGVPTTPLGGTTFEGAGAIPQTWIVDREGRLRASKTGLVSASSLRRAIGELLEE